MHKVLSAVLLVSAGLMVSQEAVAQRSIGRALRDILRPDVRRPQAQQPMPQRPQRLRRSPFGGGMLYESDLAVLSTPTGCAPGMRLELRYKPAAQRHSAEWASPAFYVEGAHGVNLIKYRSGSTNPLGALDLCREQRAELTVYAPGGQVVARDTLLNTLVQGWESQRGFEQIRRAGEAETAAAPVGPEEVKALGNILADAGRLAERERNDCRQRLDSQSRPMTQDIAANRAAAQRYQREMAACNANAGRISAGIYDRIVRGARDFAAAQPVSYDGLKALTAAETTYRYSLNTDRRGSTGNANAKVLETAIREIEARRSAIEGQLFERIVADMNKPGGGPQFIETLFGSRDGRRIVLYDTMYYDPALIARIPRRTNGGKLFYERATDIGKSTRERSQAAAYTLWSEPSENEMALALMRAMLMSGGKQVTQNVVTVPGALNRLGIDALDDFAGLYMQIYDVKKNGCRREAGGYRCTMTVYARAISRGGVGREGFGAAMVGMTSASLFGAQSEVLFVPTRSGWRVPEREAAVAGAQARQMEQLSDVATKIVDAGSNAMSVLTSARQGDAAEPGEDSQAEKERKQRVEDEERRRRGN